MKLLTEVQSKVIATLEEKYNDTVVNEAMNLDTKKLIKDFENEGGKGKVTTADGAQRVKARTIPVKGHHWDETNDGIVPIIKYFFKKGKKQTISLKGGETVVIDIQRNDVYGISGNKFFLTTILDIDLV